MQQLDTLKMPKNITYIGITFLIGCLVFLIGNALFNGLQFASFEDLTINFLFYQLYAFIIGYSNMLFFSYYNKKNKDKNISVKRILIGILVSVIITFMGLFLLRALTAILVNHQSFSSFLANEHFSNYTFGLWITLTIVITFHAVFFINKLQQNKLKEQKVIATSATAQFDALKNQLDPHFLFNSLNVLTSLIDEDTAKAQEFTTALSKIYRYVLEQKDKDVVALEEELDFAKTYISLLKMRFENSILFELPKTVTTESKVVPLALQLLLENAVKHNIATTKEPLQIKIFVANGLLLVENNLQPKQVLNTRKGVGLNNIINRYKLLTNKPVQVTETKKAFTVSIPILTKKTTVMKTDSSNINQNYIRARKHVDELKGFYYSLIAFCIVIPILIVIWYQFTPNTFQWFWFSILGWGIGLSFQAYKVFIDDGKLGKSWEERKIAAYMKKEEEQKWK